MNLDALIQAASAFSLTEKERRGISFIIVEAEVNIRNSMRHALVSLGYDTISDAADAQLALQKMEDRLFTHMIFDANSNKMPNRQFLATVMRMNPNLIAIPSSYQPTIDDVFDLLISGARGYIVKPFTSGSLEEAIVWATKGDPISESIHNARSRNEALASLIYAALDRLALVLKQSRRFDTAKREIPRRYTSLKRSLEIGRTFAKGGEQGLRRALIELAIERGGSHIGSNAQRKRQRRRISEIVDETSVPHS